MFSVLKKLFTEHPNSVNESYFEHMIYALKCGFILVFAGLGCLVHAFFPFLFTTKTSETVVDMYGHIKERNPKYKTK